MKIFVIGNGGREHAIVWKLSLSPLVKKIFCAPSNAGIDLIAERVPINVTDTAKLLDFAKTDKIDLTVVGPEVPLANGIVDLFSEKGLLIFGPTKAAAKLEYSKVFSKYFMRKYKIPTANYEISDNLEDAKSKIDNHGYPLVIKADGLAAGKGVFVCERPVDGQDAIEKIFRDRIFGSSGNSIVIEDKLDGEEASYMVISDGSKYVPLSSSQDHKTIFDGDIGPNTGGMGAYSPAPVVDSEVEDKIKKKIIEPAIEGMNLEGYPLKGTLYAGIMIKGKEPYTLEYNCRFGDPETQPIFVRMNEDLLPYLIESANGNLTRTSMKWHESTSVCIVLASKGYPGSYEKGKKIEGLEKFQRSEDLFAFHAGTSRDDKGNFITDGGRVLGVASLSPSIPSAIKRAYEGVSMLDFENIYYRKDIGLKALKYR
ncbi:Phosphoribosylamine--glycine ligase [uncultured archaeon]|nr:Phosphoribosylamine--glycine ligase [uncultured archaeon]